MRFTSLAGSAAGVVGQVFVKGGDTRKHTACTLFITQRIGTVWP